MKFLVAALLSLLSLSAFSQIETYEMSSRDVGVANLLIQATLETNETRTFVKYAGFDSVSVTAEEVGKFETIIIDAVGSYLEGGDVLCGELKLKITIVHTSTPGGTVSTYKAVLDKSGLAEGCDID